MIKAWIGIIGIFSLVFASSSAIAQQGVSTSRYNRLIHLNQDLSPRAPAWSWQQFNITSFANFDVTPKTMQKTLAGEEHDYFALSNIGVNVDANFHNYFMSHVGLAYFKTNKGQGDRYKSSGLILDDAYAIVGDFEQYPVYGEAGRFYLPFATYNRYTIVPPLTQILAIAREAGVQVGIANWHGLTGVVYISQGQLRRGSIRIQSEINGGAALHYNLQQRNGFHFMAGAEYIFNMLHVNALTQSGAFNPNISPNSGNYIFSKSIPGVAAQVKVGYRLVTLFGQYVTALKRSNNLIKRYVNYINLTNPIYGAQPSAWDAGVMVKFKLFHRTNRFDITYSRSKDMAGLYIFNSTRNHVVPKERYILGYTVYINQYVYAQLQWAHDSLYPPTEGDTGRQGDDATIRVGIKF